jgi:16S rRNA (cytosine967-C5)-methyltransferase
MSDAPSASGVETRRAALRILDRVLRSGQTVDSASWVAEKLAPEDRALALAIVGETFRRMPKLDALIDGVTRQKLPEDSKARMVLRLALAQKLALGTPDHAIVATALPLVDGGPRRLVHGVLGTLLRRRLDASEAPALPEDVELRWRRAWGDDVVEAARRQIIQRAALDLSFASDAGAKAFAEASGGRSLADRHVRIQSQSVTDLPGYGAGGWWVQDLAASLPARLIPKGPDVVDLCAAPGGKTMQLAAAGHVVIALDSSKGRLKRLSENLSRTGLSANLIEADARSWAPDGPVDSILLDAPCSATGTFRRHPEVLYRVKPRFIKEAADAQLALLGRAASWLRPGGTLVYSVCALEPEEGEEVVDAFLATNPNFVIHRPETGELPEFVPVANDGWVRILPGLLAEEGGLDGFFIARLVRTG